MSIKYATKCWSGDYKIVNSYHPNADVIYGNNMSPEEVDEAFTLLGTKFRYIGEGHPYTVSELYAVNNVKSEYILWYASDVKPPAENWIETAIPLLEEYPIVSPFWSEPYKEYVKTCDRQEVGGFKQTDFGFEDHMFSDHAYIARTEVMRNIDYETDSYVKKYYPPHGGNSFECRVAQWLEATDQRRAVLKDFQYRHTTGDEK